MAAVARVIQDKSKLSVSQLELVVSQLELVLISWCKLILVDSWLDYFIYLLWSMIE